MTLSSELIRIIINVALTVGILIIVRHIGYRVIRTTVRKTITGTSARDERMREDTLIQIITAIFKISLWIFGGMMILAQLGVNLGPLIAGASISGIAIGFGAQAIVKDFLSGIFIILENQYRLGDVVTLADTTGTVEAITIRRTILRDADGHKHYIPNGQIGVTTNMTMGYSNLVLNLDVAYEADIEKVKKIVNEVGQKLATDADFKKDIINAPLFVRLQDFNLYGIVVRVSGKVKPGQQWRVAGELRWRLKLAFDQHKIPRPHPDHFPN